MEALQDASFSPGLDKMKDAAIHGLHTDAVRQHLHDRLKVVTLRGVTIKGLDNALQNDDDRALKGFFLWLQDQLNDWSSPEPDVYRPQIQSFCDRLRNRHLEDKRIIDFFQLWKSAQAQIDASIQRRVLLVEDLLLQYLYRKKKNTPPPSSHPPVRQCAGPNLDQPHTKQPEKPLLSVDALTEKSRSGRENITAMEKRGAIEVSSGGKDSEVGFLGAKSPNGRPGHPMRKNKMKPKFPSSPVVQGAREILNGSYNDSHHPSSVVDTRRTEVENKVGKPNKGRYVCNRCHRPGKADELLTQKYQMLTSLDQNQAMTSRSAPRILTLASTGLLLVAMCAPGAVLKRNTTQRSALGTKIPIPGTSCVSKPASTAS